MANEVTSGVAADGERGNRIILGDNLAVLGGMADGVADLIYIDPPFNTGRRQERRRLRTTADAAGGDRTGFQGKRYRTVEVGRSGWDDRFDDFPAFLAPRLLEARRVLQPEGSLFVHIDYREVHYCKVLLDGIFGRDSFLNEIIWAYDYGARAQVPLAGQARQHPLVRARPAPLRSTTRRLDRIPYMAPGLVGPEKARAARPRPMSGGTRSSARPAARRPAIRHRSRSG
jgi:site-specific DNA-methyltransferase (adenine-specific)